MTIRHRHLGSTAHRPKHSSPLARFVVSASDITDHSSAHDFKTPSPKPKKTSFRPLSPSLAIRTKPMIIDPALLNLDSPSPFELSSPRIDVGQSGMAENAAADATIRHAQNLLHQGEALLSRAGNPHNQPAPNCPSLRTTESAIFGPNQEGVRRSSMPWHSNTQPAFSVNTSHTAPVLDGMSSPKRKRVFEAEGGDKGQRKKIMNEHGTASASAEWDLEL